MCLTLGVWLDELDRLKLRDQVRLLFIFRKPASVARSMVTRGNTDYEGAIQTLDGHCQVDEKLVDRPPRYWAPARREPAMLGIKNGRQPQLDNTRWGTYAYAAAARLGGDAALGGAAPDADRRRSAAGVAGARPLWDRHPS